MRDWKKWMHAAGVRAVKTVAQTAVATIGTAAVLGDVMIPRISREEDGYTVVLCSREDMIYAVVWMGTAG